MKITRTRLSQLINEEVNRVLLERTPAGEPNDPRTDSGPGKWIGNTRLPAPKLGPRERELLATAVKEKWDASNTVAEFESVMSEMATDMKDYMIEGSQLVVRFVGGINAGIDMWKNDGVKPDSGGWPRNSWIPRMDGWHSMKEESLTRNQLGQLIKEELGRLSEDDGSHTTFLEKEYVKPLEKKGYKVVETLNIEDGIYIAHTSGYQFTLSKDEVDQNYVIVQTQGIRGKASSEVRLEPPPMKAGDDSLNGKVYKILKK
jgi:hypothetical protein